MGRPMRSHRTLIEGSIYRLRTGCAWRDLSAEFGLWQTVGKRHARCCKDGIWDAALVALQSEADTRAEIDWNVSAGSTFTRVHQHGATAARSEVKVTAHTGVFWGTVRPPQNHGSAFCCLSAGDSPRSRATLNERNATP